MEINKSEAIEYLTEGMDIKVVVNDCEFVVGDMHNYIGSPDNEVGYISEYLGNIWYSDAEAIINDTLVGMTDNDKNLISKAKFFIG